MSENLNYKAYIDPFLTVQNIQNWWNLIKTEIAIITVGGVQKI